MAGPPTPEEIFDRAVEEGQRRLDQSLLELTSTSFIAGFTIVFGIVALGMVEALVEPRYGEVARVGGALAFGVGLVFLVAGRTELFNENFSDPAAAAIQGSTGAAVPSLLRLWTVTLVFNLAGGFLFAMVFSVEGSLPHGAPEVLAGVAEATVREPAPTWFASAVAGGALVSVLSFLLVAAEGDWSRFFLAYVVGVLLALGAFRHVVVTAIHVFFGVLYGASVDAVTFAALIAVVTAGNLLGGLALVTLTHVAQAKGARESEA